MFAAYVQIRFPVGPILVLVSLPSCATRSAPLTVPGSATMCYRFEYARVDDARRLPREVMLGPGSERGGVTWVTGGGLSSAGRRLMTQMPHGWERTGADSLLIYFSSGLAWTEHRVHVTDRGELHGKAKLEGDATVGLGDWITVTGKPVRCRATAGEPVAAPTVSPDAAAHARFARAHRG
jgi:hypothetical protein